MVPCQMSVTGLFGQPPGARALLEETALVEKLPDQLIGAGSVTEQVGGEGPYGEKRQADRHQEGPVEGRSDRLQHRGQFPDSSDA